DARRICIPGFCQKYEGRFMSWFDLVSKHIAYPLWDFKDKSKRLPEWRSLEQQQWWSSAEIKQLQRRRLQALLEHAAQHSPWYRDLFAQCGLDVARSVDMEEFRKLPVTTKQQIRDNTDRFISDNYEKDHLVKAK